ncbi:MAG: hypothetical protein AABX54_01310 [Nanoarchaeota archaeon]
MGLAGILYVEEDTEEAERAIELMNSFGLPFHVLPLKKREAEERRRNCDEIPMLLSWPGIFKGLEKIEWYVKCYGKNGPQHSAFLEADKRIKTFYSRLEQNPYAFLSA